jgi:hypothetical protein
MAETFATLIIPAGLATQGRNLGAALSPAGHGMFVVGLSANGSEPASHYVSTGMLHEQFAGLLADANALYAGAQSGAQAQGITLTETLADCEALVAQSDVSADPPFDAFARLGLTLVQSQSL